MSREIKFKGKRIDNGGWVYGYLVGSVDSFSVKRFVTKGPVYQAYEVIPETVGQYTGLKDKNGKEIYEGDVLKVIDPNNEENVRCVVEWDEYGGCFSYEPDSG